MWSIRELSGNNQVYIRELVSLHSQAFPDFFLTKLGEPFLRTLYKGYLDDPNSGIIVAEDNCSLLGFIAYSNDYPGFYKRLIKEKIVQFAWCSFLAVLRHPLFIKRILGAFGKSDSVVKDQKYVELASICVSPSAEGRGVGSALIDYLKSMVDFSEYAYINLETDADDNEKAIEFYLKNGFVLAREYYTREKRRMHEYRYAEKTNSMNVVLKGSK